MYGARCRLVILYVYVNRVLNPATLMNRSGGVCVLPVDFITNLILYI